MTNNDISSQHHRSCLYNMSVLSHGRWVLHLPTRWILSPSITVRTPQARLSLVAVNPYGYLEIRAHDMFLEFIFSWGKLLHGRSMCVASSSSSSVVAVGSFLPLFCYSDSVKVRAAGRVSCIDCEVPRSAGCGDSIECVSCR